MNPAVDFACDACRDEHGTPRHDPGFCAAAALGSVTCSKGHVTDHSFHSGERMGKLIGMSHTRVGNTQYAHAVDEDGRVWRLIDHGPHGWRWAAVPVERPGHR